MHGGEGQASRIRRALPYTVIHLHTNMTRTSDGTFRHQSLLIRATGRYAFPLNETIV